MSYHQVALHFVWATKYREKKLSPCIRKVLFKHIQEYCKSKDIWLDFIGGYTDHIHLLIWLQPKQTVDGIANLIKGESSHWFNNKSAFKYHNLSWQKGYYVTAVKFEEVYFVREYIRQQENYHRSQEHPLQRRINQYLSQS